jgi:hypothetical protein
MRECYPYLEALNDLSVFFEKHVKDESCLDELRTLLSICKDDESVAAREFNNLYFAYRKEFQDYSKFTKNEELMWDDLMHFWG